MTFKQLWSIIRGRRTNYRFLNISWTYYPGGDPMGKKPRIPQETSVTSENDNG